MASITTVEGTETYADETAARFISAAVFRDGFVEATMYGFTLRIIDEATAEITYPGTPGITEPSTLTAPIAEARLSFLNAVEY